jgi:hypothetical protein
MRFYTKQHQFYCGIDLHARTMYVCIMNQEGEILVHRNMATTTDDLVKVIEPYRSDVVLCVECIFTWYWIADLCSQIVTCQVRFPKLEQKLFQNLPKCKGHNCLLKLPFSVKEQLRK